MEPTTTTPKTKKQDAMAEFDAKVKEYAEKASAEERALYDSMIDANGTTQRIKLTAGLAALCLRNNPRNRDFSLTKAQAFAEVQARGEWMFNHQGMGFYPDGSLFDAQHRCAAVVISEIPMDILSTPNLDSEAILTVDMSTARTAGQALQMDLVQFGNDKASIAKRLMAYNYFAQNGKAISNLTQMQINHFVKANDRNLQEAIDIAEGARERFDDPVLKLLDACSLAAIALSGGWPVNLVSTFIFGVLAGKATSDNDPAFMYFKRLEKSRLSEKRKDHLSPIERDATGIKAMVCWKRGEKVARLSWAKGKEPLPSPVYAAVEDDDEVSASPIVPADIMTSPGFKPTVLGNRALPN